MSEQGGMVRQGISASQLKRLGELSLEKLNSRIEIIEQTLTTMNSALDRLNTEIIKLKQKECDK